MVRTTGYDPSSSEYPASMIRLMRRMELGKLSTHKGPPSLPVSLSNMLGIPNERLQLRNVYADDTATGPVYWP